MYTWIPSWNTQTWYLCNPSIIVVFHQAWIIIFNSSVLQYVDYIILSCENVATGLVRGRFVRS